MVIDNLSSYDNRILNIDEYKIDFSKVTGNLSKRIMNSIKKVTNRQLKCTKPN